MKPRALLSLCLLPLLCLTACNAAPEPDAAASTTAAPATTASPVTTAAPEPEPEPIKPPKSLKILAIGNSFSVDAMQYLWQIMAEGGVEEIILGNLYYGGCSLEQHLKFANGNSPAYKYYKNTTGQWTTTENYRMADAIADEDWDIITMQQTSRTCGLRDSYGATLTALVDYVRARNTTADLVWHATWAYAQNSTHASFPNYGRSQTKMYDMIIDCVEHCIETEPRFASTIPAMTAIQNARTSFLGDNLNRDGYHLDYNIGRYVAGLCWYAALTGCPVDAITYNPAPQKITDDMLAVAREAVTNAIATPKAVTPSAITTGTLPDPDAGALDPSVVLDPADFYEADANLAATQSIDLAKYTRLDWKYLENTYWNCSSSPNTTTPGTSASTYHQNVCVNRKYALDELPAGTVFICDSGWQYRLELYTDPDKKFTGKRPSLSTAAIFTLTDDFLGEAKYVAWNIAAHPKADISAVYAQAAAHLRIYVPKA